MSFIQEDKTSVMKVRKLGYARVRLLPKDAGVRPIVNLRRRAAKGQSINQILHAAFQILTFEKVSATFVAPSHFDMSSQNKQPDLMGAATLGASEVYAKLKDFKLRLQETYTTM
jgi:telomerase reverse transcriptase